MRIALALFLLALPALPQALEVFVSGGPTFVNNANIGQFALTPDEPRYRLTDGFRISIMAGLNTGSRIGHEVGYAYLRTQLRSELAGETSESGVGGHQAIYNFFFHLTRDGTRGRPYVFGGANLANYVSPGGGGASGGGDTKFGLQYGGGIKIRFYEIFGFRIGAHQFTSPKPFNLTGRSGWVRFSEISVGFGLML